VSIKDPAGGAVREFTGTGGIGQVTWDGTDQAAAPAPDAGYAATLTVDADPSLVDSLILELDTQPPTIYGGSAYPADHSTTVFASQPLLVGIEEDGSGVDPLELAFTLADETAGTSKGYLGVFVSGWARAQGIELIGGHRYRFGVKVADLAGNEAPMMQRPAADGGGFVASFIEPDAATGQIAPLACALSEPPRSALGMALHAVTLVVHQRLALDIERYAGTVDLWVIPPLCPIAVPPTDFSQAASLIDRAQGHTREWLTRGGTPGEASLPRLGHPHAVIVDLPRPTGAPAGVASRSGDRRTRR
jgi:hypothetical protein